MEQDFVGEYEHSLDLKGRVILPAKFRDRLERGGYLSKLLDGCLAIYTPEEFKLRTSAMQEQARRGQRERNMVRMFTASTVEILPDRQGRIAIPQQLRDFAQFDRDLKIIGVIDRIEIWDSEKWNELNAASEAEARNPGPDLDDVGI
ncbi:MAG: division/cell wall cluster transcriptional repressor MraZ [Acidimicrobiales bacterium]